ncbi:MAG: hypothetical protein ACK5V7_03370 [bacterium]
MADKLEKRRGYVPGEELEAYPKGVFGDRIGLGEHVALLNIDTTQILVDPQYSMCAQREPALEAEIKRKFGGAVKTRAVA